MSGLSRCIETINTLQGHIDLAKTVVSVQSVLVWSLLNRGCYIVFTGQLQMASTLPAKPAWVYAGWHQRVGLPGRRAGQDQEAGLEWPHGGPARCPQAVRGEECCGHVDGIPTILRILFEQTKGTLMKPWGDLLDGSTYSLKLDYIGFNHWVLYLECFKRHKMYPCIDREPHWHLFFSFSNELRVVCQNAPAPKFG